MVGVGTASPTHAPCGTVTAQALQKSLEDFKKRSSRCYVACRIICVCVCSHLHRPAGLFREEERAEDMEKLSRLDNKLIGKRAEKVCVGIIGIVPRIAYVVCRAELGGPVRSMPLLSVRSTGRRESTTWAPPSTPRRWKW